MSGKDRELIINKIIDFYFELSYTSASEKRDESDRNDRLRRLFVDWLWNGEDNELKEEAIWRKFNELMPEENEPAMAEMPAEEYQL